MIEGQALESQYSSMKESDPVGAQRVYQQLQQNEQQRASSVQNLAQMGFDVQNLTTLDQVNEVGQAFEQEFNTVSGGQGSVVVSGNTQARSITPYGRKVSGPVADVKPQMYVPETQASAPFINGRQQQVASLYDNGGSGNVVQMPTRTVTATGGPQSNDTRRTIRAKQETRIVSGDPSVGVDHIDVVSEEHVTHESVGGGGPRRTIVNQVQGSRVVQGQPSVQSQSPIMNPVSGGILGGGYSGPAPIQPQASGPRNLGTTTLTTDTTEFVQGASNDTRRTVRRNNNVRVQERASQATDTIEFHDEGFVQYEQSQPQSRRNVVRTTKGQPKSPVQRPGATYGPNNKVQPAPLSRKPKK